MDRRDFGKAIVAAGATLAASKAYAGPATSDMRSNFAFKKEESPVILEVAISGSTTKKINPAAPETASELAEEAIKCLDAGATIVHAHTNKPSENIDEAVQAYVDVFTPVRKKHPHGILYPTANFHPATYHEMRTVWPPDVQSGHYRPLAEAGLANMILLDTGVVPGFLVVRLLARRQQDRHRHLQRARLRRVDLGFRAGLDEERRRHGPGGHLAARLEAQHLLRRLRFRRHAATDPRGASALPAHD
jgi:hypothetical protein